MFVCVSTPRLTVDPWFDDFIASFEHLYAINDISYDFQFQITNLAIPSAFKFKSNVNVMIKHPFLDY